MAIAIVVEDGTGKADANSFGAIADADTYHELRGNGAWAALSSDQKATNLILATDYMCQVYGARWKGVVATDVQALDWPRKDTGNVLWDYVLPEDEGYPIALPVNLQKACYEYAARVQSAPLAPDPAVDAAGVAVVTTLQKVGVIERRFAPIGGGGSGTVQLIRAYPGADMYLRDLVIPAGDRVIR